MSTPIIEVKNIGKKYNITHQKGKYIALRDVLANILRSPWRFLIKKTKAMAGLETKEEFWALKNINFTVEKGEVIGIIGHNGAGKSTLLKILSQITPPTEGEIILNGRVGSLLEVGTGFHPELTGRENIFLNGAILGMSRQEIAQKFDQIVEFSGVKKFLDTPVKYFSSGMYVRLAFSVAAHMEPDILIVDEVLAVGDADFQKKCLGKMGEITNQDGRTILFVSHNLGAIKQLCKKTILLDSGSIKMIGNTDDVIEYYLDENNKKDELTIFKDSEKRRNGNGKMEFKGVKLLNDGKKENDSFYMGDTVNVQIEIAFHQDLKNIQMSLEILDIYQSSISHLTNEDDGFLISGIKEGRYFVTVSIPNFYLSPGDYSLSLWAGNATEIYDNLSNCHYLKIIQGDRIKRLTPFPSHVKIFLPSKWKI